MKRILLAGSALFIALTVVWAQDQKVTPTDKPQRNVAVQTVDAPVSGRDIAQIRTQRMHRIVQLTETQQKSVYAVYAQVARDRAAKDADIRQKIDGILTPDQKQKLDIYEKENARKMTERRQPNGDVQKSAPGKVNNHK